MREKVKRLIPRFPIYPDTGVGGRMRCPNCGSLDTQVKDSRPTEDSAGDPPPPHLPDLRFPLHHLRARATARTRGHQAQRPPRAVRSRQADALAVDCAAQAAGRAGAGRADGVQDRAPARKHRRERDHLGNHRRAGDGAPARRSTTSPMCASPRSTRISASRRTSSRRSPN